MTRRTTTVVLGLLSVGSGCVVLLLALYLGFSIEATARAVGDSAKAHRIAVPAVVAVVAGVITLAVRRRRWAPGAAGVGVAAAIVAVALTVVISGGHS